MALSKANLLQELGIERVAHYTPLHYLVFIARSRKLKGKPVLHSEGFAATHFRSKSCRQDTNRGFGGYAFLTLDDEARILKAKLRAGFPHIGVQVPSAIIDSVEYYLCRYNVAMTRQLRRKDKSGFPASATNGRYYGNHQIPIAKDTADKVAMLRAHRPKGTMIEVLVPDFLELPDVVTISCFAPEDEDLVKVVLKDTDCPWTTEIIAPPGPYNRRKRYVGEVEQFVQRALADPLWRGNGLEFDRV